MSKSSTAGRKDEKVRSDCWVSFETTDSGAFEITINSKVESMYGKSIRELCIQTLTKLGIKNARLELCDYGAPPFVLMARIEAAVRRVGLESPECLPEMKEHCRYKTNRDRFRRTRLYLPGNEPKFFLNAGIHKPDGVILDLEDSVSPTEKDAARILVRNALRQVNFYGSERIVRINQGENGLEDLIWVIPHNVHVILIPKVERSDQVKAVDDTIKLISEKIGLKDTVYLIPIIESALGAINAYQIATSSPNIIGLTLGLEDYTADIGVQRTLEGRESFWLRSVIVNAAIAAGVQPIDTVFSDVSDMEGLQESVIEAKSLGFVGKGCIHPRQIAEVHKAFAPTEIEIKKAKKVVLAFDKAEKEGLGVVSLGSKMIDPPVVKRALRTVEMAESLGILEKGWRERQ